MPTPASPEPLTRLTLNIFAADAEFLKRKHGQGWTGVIRAAVRAHVLVTQQTAKVMLGPEGQKRRKV